MSHRRHRLRSSLLGAVGFGFGFVVGALLTNLIFSSQVLAPLLDLFQGGRLTIGLVLTLLVTGLGGAVGGALGGLALSYAHQSTQRGGYAWRGALSFGVSYGLILVPLTLAVALLGFYEIDEISPLALMAPLGVMGALFGAVSGAILGLLTVGRHTWRVVLAGTFSFALGGAGLGQGLFGYLFNLADMDSGRWAIFAGLFVFGALGGGALGYLYDGLAHREPKPSIFSRFGSWFKTTSPVKRIAAVAGLVLLVLLLRAVWLISPLNAYRAPLNTKLDSRTIDTHWREPVSLVENALQPAIFAPERGQVASAWSQESNGQTDIHYLTGQNGNSVNVSASPTASTNPQLVVDRAGTTHLVWVENDADILYSRCNGSTCTEPVGLSSDTQMNCLPDPSAQNAEPTIAIDPADRLMVAWRNGRQGLVYSTWSAAANPPQTPTGCVPGEAAGQQPRLATGGGDDFSLVFAGLSDIYLSRYANEQWSLPPERIGAGQLPEIFIDREGQTHLAWCNSGKGLGYYNSAGQSGQIPFSQCAVRPGLASGGNGSLRLVWYSAEVKTVTGAVRPNALIYESFQTDTGWTEPAIIAQSGGPTQPALAAGGDGVLHLAWSDQGAEPASLYYSSHTDYDCTAVELSTTEQAVFDGLSQERYRQTAAPIPFCHNEYDRLLYAPNPLPAFSQAEPTPNGTFDKFAELARTAQYEVVFATMWYDSFSKADNPGRVLGKAIAELYQNLKEDPARYPRGLTVRLLLGNPPSLALFPTFNNQVRHLIDDLREAGVPELSNEELGWKVEVANYSGAWPHSHTKIMVVDGKTVQSVGYNMQYTHLPTDHPSGKGKGRVDIGLQITGPVAQSSLRAFDELWQASTRITCSTIDPSESAWWVLTCRTQPAVPDHVPEVLRYYLADQGSNAFTLFRTEKFRGGDEAYYQALASATDTIDTIHINFSLELICALNIFLEACNYANRIDYMDAIMQAIEQNDVKARILVSDVAWVGIENNIAIDVFEDELVARGLSDNVEIRYFEQDMHIKAALIDRQFLIVGNQNFHYSAWGGEGTLAEFNIGTGDPEAIEDFERFFNYYWDRAKKRE